MKSMHSGLKVRIPHEPCHWIDQTNLPADLNDDGTIDGADLALILTYWGDCY